MQNAGKKYCRMLQREQSAILLTFIKQPFVIKIFVLSIFEWPFYTGFTVVYAISEAVPNAMDINKYCISTVNVPKFQTFSGLQIRVHIRKLFSSFLNQNVCCGYSKELPQ